MEKTEVVLTEAESRDALKWASEKKAAELAAKVEAKRLEDEAAAEAEKQAKIDAENAASRKDSPRAWVGILVEGMVDPAYYPNANTTARDRTIEINGSVFEHTHEDADGVWIYRHFGR